MRRSVCMYVCVCVCVGACTRVRGKRYPDITETQRDTDRQVSFSKEPYKRDLHSMR